MELSNLEEHRQEVEAEYQEILARCEKGNPPEIQAKIEQNHAKFQARLAEHRRRKAEENNHARHSDGRLYLP